NAQRRTRASTPLCHARRGTAKHCRLHRIILQLTAYALGTGVSNANRVGTSEKTKHQQQNRVIAVHQIGGRSYSVPPALTVINGFGGRFFELIVKNAVVLIA